MSSMPSQKQMNRKYRMAKKIAMKRAELSYKEDFHFTYNLNLLVLLDTPMFQLEEIHKNEIIC